MAGFTEGAFMKKLSSLYSSQQCIQTLSLWLIHHKKHHATIVKVWFRELLKVNDNSQKLTYMYLANDVIQNSNKKGPELRKEFASVLPKAFASIEIPESDNTTLKSLERILTIWEQRGVYDTKVIKDCRKGMVRPGIEGTPPTKKAKVETEKVTVVVRNKATPVRKHKLSETEMEVDGVKERHTTLSPCTSPAGDAPEPEELIKALQDLENSASSDAAVREKIAGLPPEVSEINLLAKLEDKASAERLAVQVNEALDLLNEYNARLSLEMEDRKKVATMLHDFIQTQKDMLAHSEAKLEEYTEKLKKVAALRWVVQDNI